MNTDIEHHNAASGVLPPSVCSSPCVCGASPSPTHSSDTHCWWCGSKLHIEYPEGSQIHVWSTNGKVVGVTQTIPPQERDGMMWFLNPVTGIETKIAASVWKTALREAEEGIGTLNYQTGVALMFAMSLGQPSYDAVRRLLDGQKQVTLQTKNHRSDVDPSIFLLSRISLTQESLPQSAPTPSPKKETGDQVSLSDIQDSSAIAGGAVGKNDPAHRHGDGDTTPAERDAKLQ